MRICIYGDGVTNFFSICLQRRRSLEKSSKFFFHPWVHICKPEMFLNISFFFYCFNSFRVLDMFVYITFCIFITNIKNMQSHISLFHFVKTVLTFLKRDFNFSLYLAFLYLCCYLLEINRIFLLCLSSL